MNDWYSIKNYAFPMTQSEISHEQKVKIPLMNDISYGDKKYYLSNLTRTSSGNEYICKILNKMGNVWNTSSEKTWLNTT